MPLCCHFILPSCESLCHCAYCCSVTCHFCKCDSASCNYSEFHYASCHYGECHKGKYHYFVSRSALCLYALCHYAEYHISLCHYDECLYAECHSFYAIIMSAIMLSVVMLNVSTRTCLHHACFVNTRGGTQLKADSSYFRPLTLIRLIHNRKNKLNYKNFMVVIHTVS